MGGMPMPQADRRTGKVRIPDTWQALAFAILLDSGSSPAARELAQQVLEAAAVSPPGPPYDPVVRENDGGA